MSVLTRLRDSTLGYLGPKLGQARGLSTSQPLGQMLKCSLEPLLLYHYTPVPAAPLKEELNCLAAPQMPTPTWGQPTVDPLLSGEL